METIQKFQWMKLSREVREKLVHLFGLERTGISEIRDDEVISDGFSDSDLQSITKEKMCEITGLPCELSFSSLWEVITVKVANDVHPLVTESKEEIINNVDVPPVQNVYCTTCTSTKGRHKKGCPKFK